MFEVWRSVIFPTLPSITVFLYFLALCLKLGALDLSNSSFSLKFGFPAVLLSALASAFARHIWCMLARYLRNADMTDIERGVDVLLYEYLSGLGRVTSKLVAIAYLYPLVSKKKLFKPIFLVPLTPDARCIIITWLSIPTYVAGLGCTVCTYIDDLLETHSSWPGAGYVCKESMRLTPIYLQSS